MQRRSKRLERLRKQNAELVTTNKDNFSRPTRSKRLRKQNTGFVITSKENFLRAMLDELPLEIVAHVLWFASDSVRGLAPLRQVCRELCHLVSTLARDLVVLFTTETVVPTRIWPSLRSLTISFDERDDSGDDRLNSLFIAHTNIQSLTIIEKDSSKDDPSSFHDMLKWYTPNLPNLRHLEIDSPHMDFNSVNWPVWSTLSRITSLSLNMWISDVSFLVNLPKLESLSIQGGVCLDTNAFAHLTSLEKVHIRQETGDFPKLHDSVKSLKYYEFCEDDMETLGQLTQCQLLATNADDESTVAQFFTALPKLKGLSLLFDEPAQFGKIKVPHWYAHDDAEGFGLEVFYVLTNE